MRRRTVRMVAHWLALWLAVSPLLAVVGCVLTCDVSPSVALCCTQERHEHLSDTPATSHECQSCTVCHSQDAQPTLLASQDLVGKWFGILWTKPSEFQSPLVLIPQRAFRVNEARETLLLKARLYLRAPPPSTPV